MKKKFSLKNILIFFGFLFMIGAFLSVLGPGFTRDYSSYSYDEYFQGTYINTIENTYLFGLLFGLNLSIVQDFSRFDGVNPKLIANAYYGPVSYLGLIAFILLAAAFVSYIVFTLWDKPLVRLCLTSALLISGILMFFVLEVGTYYVTYNYVYTFREFFKLDDYYNGIPYLGAGVYCFSAFSFASSICFMVEGSIGVYKKRKLKLKLANGEVVEEVNESNLTNEVKEESPLKTNEDSSTLNVNEETNKTNETLTSNKEETNIKEKKIKEPKPKKVKKHKNKDEVDFNL